MRYIFLLICLLITTSPEASAQSTYTLKDDQPSTGSHLKRKPIRSEVFPLDKPYEKFTDQERAQLLDLWEPMKEGDEPPFPKYGMRELSLDILNAASKVGVRGELSLVAYVNPDGKVSKVEVYKSPNDQLVRFAAHKLVTTPFKAAVCSGKPCAMQFPFFLQIVPSLPE